ncbi:unnamed protein product [Larinioides sclopetarius]|uniref:Uncharacterized protein n=1 Tax=Larinioides sclopetarius TaxID=280406 RepID=A0AAV1YZC0_9ARAC
MLDCVVSREFCHQVGGMFCIFTSGSTGWLKPMAWRRKMKTGGEGLNRRSIAVAVADLSSRLPRKIIGFK